MIVIRKANKSDIDAIHYIEKESFSDFYPSSFLEDLFEKNHDFFVISVDGNIVGYAVTKIKTGGIVHIVAIAVLSKYRNKKLGTKFLGSIHDYYNASKTNYFFLEVKNNNEKAIRLYKSLGYNISEFRKNYYPDMSHAFLMKRKL